jgi:hypothetical protein
MEMVVVGPADYQELAAFMSNFPDVKARTVEAWIGRFRAWWDLNPAYQASFARGWALRHDGRVVGFFGSLPLKLQVAGNEATVFGATSWRVLPEGRGKSLSLKMKQLEEHKDTLHFSTTPREDLIPLLKRLGYRQIARGAGTDAQSQYIIDGARFWRGRLHPVLTGVAGLALSVYQALRTSALRARADVRELTAADAAFDDLWARTKTRFATTNIRTAAMLNWYCFAMQPADKKLLGFYEGGRLLGYMVIRLKEDVDRRMMECVDLWLDPAADERRVLAGLVGKAVDTARQAGHERVLFPHFDERTAKLFGELGLLQGPAWTKREYVKGPKELLDGITVENSYFVRAQGDYGM